MLTTAYALLQLNPRLQHSKRRRQHQTAAAAAAATAQAVSQDFRDRQPRDVKVLVLGATGYIGKFVVKELIARGYDVVAFARSRSGVKGKSSKEDVIKVPTLSVLGPCPLDAALTSGK